MYLISKNKRVQKYTTKKISNNKAIQRGMADKVDTPREASTTGTGAGSETTKASSTSATSPRPTQKEAKGGSVSDLDRQIEALRRCEYLKESEVKAICAKAREILVDESNVQRVDAPVTVRLHF